MTRPHSVLVLVILLAALSSCQRQAQEKQAGTLPVRAVLALGRSPVHIGPVVPMPATMAAPSFKVTVKNITDASLDSISWTAIAFDENRNPLPECEVEGGYDDPLNPIAAGETCELTFTIQDEKAASVKLVLREVVYRSSDPLGRNQSSQPYKWTNPFFEAELQKARGISISD